MLHVSGMWLYAFLTLVILHLILVTLGQCKRLILIHHLLSICSDEKSQEQTLSDYRWGGRFKSQEMYSLQVDDMHVSRLSQAHI